MNKVRKIYFEIVAARFTTLFLKLTAVYTYIFLLLYV